MRGSARLGYPDLVIAERSGEFSAIRSFVQIAMALFECVAFGFNL